MLGGAGDGFRLGLRGHANEQRIERRGRHPGDAFAARPTVIEVHSCVLIPEIAIDGAAAPRRTALEVTGAIPVAGPSTTGCDGILQAEHQAVQIDGNDFRGVHGGAIASVGQRELKSHPLSAAARMSR